MRHVRLQMLIFCFLIFIRATNMQAEKFTKTLSNSSDGEVVRTFASGAVNIMGLIPNRVKPMTVKLVFTAFLLDVQH